ncbi:MAG: hypothetical protein H6686_03315 [Fibrobacteria bacterium]|nr:hypothetical protein [Fibrobacteria bacterium]
MPRPRLLALLICLGVLPVLAKPGIDRSMVRTAHVDAVGDARMGPRLDSLATLAESVWERLARTLDYRPEGRIRVTFHDEEDYSNGWAIASNQTVNVWLAPVPFTLRGGHDWLQGVLAHEMAHVFTLGALGENHSFSGLMGVGTWRDASGQVAVQAGLPVDDLDTWLVEGLAQIGAELCGADDWDAHRDFLERTAWKSGATLPDGLLRDFWGDGRQGELIYNQGYSFLRWVLSREGASLARLLREGRSKGLRRALAEFAGVSFEDLFAAWKADLARRHGDRPRGSEPGRPVLRHDRAATWVDEPSAIASGDTIWVISSKANDYGIGALREIRGGRERRLASGAVGRLHRSTDGRILVIRETRWPDRRVLRDLWSYEAAHGQWRRVTRRARVQDASDHREGFAAILRRTGRNRPAILDSRGEVKRWLPLPAEGDLVQIAASPAGDLVAVRMGAEGFELLRLGADSTWTSMGLPGQARDPSFHGTDLWISLLESGRWSAFRIPADGTLHRELSSEGGVFSPCPVGADSILVSRVQAEGVVAVVVPRSPDPAPATTPAAPLAVPTPRLEVQPMPTRSMSASELPGLVAWQLVGGYLAEEGRKDDLYRVGSKWILGAGVLCGTSTLETTLGLDVMALHGGVGEKAGWDKGLNLGFSSEAFAPVVDLGLTFLETTLEHGVFDTLLSDSATLFGGDTLPYLRETGVRLALTQALGDRSYLFGSWGNSSVGLGVRNLTENTSVTLVRQSQVQAGLGWQFVEPGRYGLLQAMAVEVSGGRLLQGGTIASEEHSAWVATAGALAATHFARRLFLQARASGAAAMFDQDAVASTLAASGTMGVPLGIPAFSIPLGGGHRWTFVDPLLEWGQDLEVEYQSVEVSSSWRGVPPRAGGSGRLLESSRRVPTLSETVRSWDVVPRVGSTLSWKVLTWGNRTSMWSASVHLPLETEEPLEDLLWGVSLSL